MIRPNELDGFFRDGLPEWITNPKIEPDPPQNQHDEYLPTIPIVGSTGILGKVRFYFFARNSGEHESDFRVMRDFKGVSTARADNGTFTIAGFLKEGTIVKVFSGFRDTPEYACGYYLADKGANEIRILPWNITSLYIQGRMATIHKGSRFAEREKLFIGRPSPNNIHSLRERTVIG